MYNLAMVVWQFYTLLLLLIFNVGLSLKGFYESYKKKNAFGKSFYFGLLGVFVWGDAVVFGAFWAIAAAISILLQDWILFWLVASLFWVIRSFGETMYWFLQQFSTVKREKPDDHKFLFKYFHNDSVWFIYQILQQCITVAAIISSIYFTNLWLDQF